MVLFRSTRKISSYLVRAKLYPLERFAGLKQSKKRRSEVCTDFTETDIFSSTVTSETFKINHELNCKDKCLIWLLKCKVYKKTICRRNNGCILAKVEQLKGQ